MWMAQMESLTVRFGKEAKSVAVNMNTIRKRAVGLQISLHERGDVTILDLWGRSTIDDGESELLSKRLRGLAANGRCKLLLNLAKVDSSGVSVIVEMYVSLERQGGELKLLGPCGPVFEVLTVFHLLDTIPSFEDETQALASFRSQGYFETASSGRYTTPLSRSSSHKCRQSETNTF
jgi:anti-anti-sigma factor